MWINPDDPSSSDNESPHRKSISRFLQCASHHLCVGASDLHCGKMAGLWHEYQWSEVATPEPGALVKYSISTSPLRTRKASIIKFASTPETANHYQHPSPVCQHSSDLELATSLRKWNTEDENDSTTSQSCTIPRKSHIIFHFPISTTSPPTDGQLFRASQ